MLRITANSEGKFMLRKPNGRPSTSPLRTVRAGHRPEWSKSDDIHAADCIWDSPKPGTIDVELPRELRRPADKVTVGSKQVSVAPVPSAR